MVRLRADTLAMADIMVGNSRTSWYGRTLWQGRTLWFTTDVFWRLCIFYFLLQKMFRFSIAGFVSSLMSCWLTAHVVKFSLPSGLFGRYNFVPHRILKVGAVPISALHRITFAHGTTDVLWIENCQLAAQITLHRFAKSRHQEDARCCQNKAAKIPVKIARFSSQRPIAWFFTRTLTD